MESDKGIVIKETTSKGLHEGLLNGFDRTQIAENVWCIIDGAKKLYISSHSLVKTQVVHEPYDIQLECHIQ